MTIHVIQICCNPFFLMHFTPNFVSRVDRQLRLLLWIIFSILWPKTVLLFFLVGKQILWALSFLLSSSVQLNSREAPPLRRASLRRRAKKRSPKLSPTFHFSYHTPKQISSQYPLKTSDILMNRVNILCFWMLSMHTIKSFPHLFVHDDFRFVNCDHLSMSI